MIFKVKVNDYSITEDENGKIKLKLSNAEGNGLSFDSEGNLIATPGSSSGTGIYNLPGNAIGPKDSMAAMNIAGMNSTVSRHKKYTGSSAFVHNNDGVVMTKLTSNGELASDCLAYFMIPHNGGGE